MLTRAGTRYRYRDAMDITSDKVSYVWRVWSTRRCEVRQDVSYRALAPPGLSQLVGGTGSPGNSCLNCFAY
jgi:hypothetical protein